MAQKRMTRRRGQEKERKIGETIGQREVFTRRSFLARIRCENRTLSRTKDSVDDGGSGGSGALLP